MKLEKMQSDLRMCSFYFEKCSIERGEQIVKGEFDADLKREFTRKSDNEYDVTLTLKIEGNNLSAEIVAKASFVFHSNGEDLDEEKKNNIIKNNTVAIMFPFIRSQVSLLTTQPGMAPIVLPPINTANFTDEM